MALAVAAFVVSLVALALGVYNALAARAERLQAKKAELHIGSSTVLLDGDDYLVEVRVTNVGKATVSYLTVALITPDGRSLSAPVRAEQGLPPAQDLSLTLRLARASVPPETPILHAWLAWDDPSGYDHQMVSGHRVRLDHAKERSAA
jgi:hypothetical protein